MKGNSILKIGESVLSRGNQTTVPTAVRTALGLSPGDTLTWHVTDQTVCVKKREGKRVKATKHAVGSREREIEERVKRLVGIE